MDSMPTANLPALSDAAAAADGPRGQRRRRQAPSLGNLGLREAGLLRQGSGVLVGRGTCMVLPRQKRGEGMGRAAAADVLGGWVGMVPASPGHAPAARGPLRPFTPQPEGRK